ncbi:MAG: arabinose-5-phosphate isomerase [Desulfobulbus propionicus]|nr:MAG: arabinose-5-phosphate isomerase [Desulfobulbus propionicus]
MSLQQAKEVLALESEGILAVRASLGEEFTEAIEILYACPSRVVISGIGKSGIIGQKIAATLNSTGTPSFFLHPVEAMHGDLGMVTASDVVLVISYSGETAELYPLLTSLKERAIPVIAMTRDRLSTLAKSAAVTLEIAVPGEACPLGLAPTTSTTATLALGDAIAVTLLRKKRFREEDFRKNHPGGSLGERLKVAVREVMLTGIDVPVVDEKGSLQDALVELNKKNIGAVVVTSKEHYLQGIVTDGDVRRLVITGKPLEHVAVQDIMTTAPVTITADLLAADALSLMQSREITILAVVDVHNRLQGILHLHDLLGKGEFRFLI